MLRANTRSLVPELNRLAGSDPLIGLNKFFGALQLNSELVPVNEDTWFGFEETIYVFQGSVCGFRVEEVGDWDEGEADHCPDDPKLSKLVFAI